MRVALAASSLLLALTLVGCKGNSLEGKWNVSAVQGLPPGSSATYEFRGGTATMTANLKQPQLGEIVVTIKGPYTLKGDALTIDGKDISLDDTKVNPAMRPMIAQMNMKDQISKGLQENNTYTIKFDSSDQVLLTGKQGTATLNRVP